MGIFVFYSTVGHRCEPVRYGGQARNLFFKEIATASRKGSRRIYGYNSLEANRPYSL